MGLSQLEQRLRSRALDNPGDIQTETLAHGASCSLYIQWLTETEIEIHLRIERTGQLPLEGSKEYAAWLREIGTFRAEKFFNVPAHADTKMVPGKRKYAATMIWCETVERESVTFKYEQRHREGVTRVSAIPQNYQEMDAWASTLGAGVRVSGIDVFTGEATK